MTQEGINASRIVYVGCGLAGKSTSLLSALHRVGQAAPDPLQVLTGEHRFVFRRASGAVVKLDISLSARRGLRGGYDPSSPDCDGVVLEEISRIVAADGLVFVVDSQSERKEANLDHFQKLTRDLAVRGVELRTKPVVFQANKRDLADIVSMDWIRTHLRSDRSAYVESIALQSVGTLEALREVVRLAGALPS